MIDPNISKPSPDSSDERALNEFGMQSSHINGYGNDSTDEPEDIITPNLSATENERCSEEIATSIKRSEEIVVGNQNTRLQKFGRYIQQKF